MALTRKRAEGNYLKADLQRFREGLIVDVVIVSTRTTSTPRQSKSRPRTHSLKSTVAARAMAERKTFGTDHNAWQRGTSLSDDRP